MQDSSKNIDQIRQLIMGSKEQEINDRLSHLEKNLQKLEKKVDVFLEAKQEKQTNSYKLIQKVKKQAKIIATLEENTEQQSLQIRDLKKQYIKEYESIIAVIKAMKSEQTAQTKKRVKKLKNEMISKEGLAEIFQELALKLHPIDDA